MIGFNFNVAAGYRSREIGNWISAGNQFWAVGPSLAMNLFDFGLRRANRAQALATRDLALANYRQTVLGAFEEVQNNLSGLAALQASRQLADQSEQDALHSYNLMKSKLEIGTASTLDVTLAEQTWITYKRQQLQTTTQQLLASVQLIKALGGGWSTAPAQR